MIFDGADYGWKDRQRARNPRAGRWALAATLGFIVIVWLVTP